MSIIQLFPFFGLLFFVHLLLLSTLQSLIFVNIAVLAFAFRVGRSLTGMLAICSETRSAVLVVAMVAHAHRIDRKVSVFAVSDLALLPTGFASLHTTGLWAGVGPRAHLLIRWAYAIRGARLSVKSSPFATWLHANLGHWAVLYSVGTEAAVLTGVDQRSSQ